MTPQLDTVIIEVSSVKGPSLRGNPLRLRIKGQTFAINANGPSVTQDFTVAELAIST